MMTDQMVATDSQFFACFGVVGHHSLSGDEPLQVVMHLSLRKEVIQPHFPVRLPCYDFTPLTERTFGTVLHCWLDKRLRVPPTRVV